jgi:cell division protein FtsL
MNTTNSSTRFIHRTILSATAAIFILSAFAATGVAQSEITDREPQFTDKEKINLEIYAERQNDEASRERYLEVARGQSQAQDREVSASRSR